MLCAWCALLQDAALLSDCIALYRLSAAFMLRLASPTAALGGPPTLPLPDPPSKEMGLLPVSPMPGIQWRYRHPYRWIINCICCCFHCLHTPP